MSLYSWNDIDNLKDYMISYLLYLEGKNISTIARIRNKEIKDIERDIIQAKIDYREEAEEDFLLDFISKTKDERLELLSSMDPDLRENLSREIYLRYTEFKEVEDRMILIWTIGELRDKRLLPFLKMELKTNSFNKKRLACSALGKIGEETTRPWLEYMIRDGNPQVRQYAIKALAGMGNMETVDLLLRHRQKGDKAYVIREIDRTIELIRERSI